MIYSVVLASCVYIYIFFKVCNSAVVQSPSPVQLFMTPWTEAGQASLSLTISQSLPKFMSIASVTVL